MMKEIQTRSNGRLEINYAAGSSILTGPKTADGIEQGLADIGLSHIGYTPGRFPQTEALDLPIGYPSRRRIPQELQAGRRHQVRYFCPIYWKSISLLHSHE